MKPTREFVRDGPRYFSPIDFKDRFPALNGIRAFAVTMVFLDHFAGGAHGGPLLNVLNFIRLRGWIGVDIFFVLSGFLITGILFDTRHDSQFFKRFFVRRSVRIFPIFYLLTAILLALTPFLHYQWRAGHLWFLVYLGNIIGTYDFSYYNVLSADHPTFKLFLGHFWSLCVEEQFYLLWPIVVWLVRDRIKLMGMATGLALLALLMRIFVVTMHRPLAETLIPRNLPFRMDTLLIGGLLALLLRGPSADRWQRLCRPLFLVAGAMSLVILGLSPIFDSAWTLTVGYTVIALASAGLIGSTLRAGSPAFRFFHRRPFDILGKYSYGFYVYHCLYLWAWIQLLVVMTNYFHSRAIAGVIEICSAFVVTFLVAKLSYDLFEVKFLKLKRYFEYDSELAVNKQDFTVS